MRISSQMIQQGALRSLRRGTEALARAQDEAATGLKIRSVSGSPVDAAQIMRLEAELRDIERYRRNATWATTRMAAEDVVVGNLRDLLDKAKTIGTSVASLPAGDPLRQSAIAEIEAIRQQVLALGNTRIGDEYIFGGGRSTSAPFLPDGTYLGDATVRKTEIDAGFILETTDTGDRVFSAALQALDGLSGQLATGDALAVQGAVGILGAAAQVVLNVQTALGGRMRTIKDTSESLARRAVSILAQRDGLRNADPVESMARLTSAQTALERAYAVVSKVLSTNLLDFLR